MSYYRCAYFLSNGLFWLFRLFSNQSFLEVLLMAKQTLWYLPKLPQITIFCFLHFFTFESDVYFHNNICYVASSRFYLTFNKRLKVTQPIGSDKFWLQKSNITTEILILHEILGHCSYCLLNMSKISLDLWKWAFALVRSN